MSQTTPLSVFDIENVLFIMNLYKFHISSITQKEEKTNIHLLCY